MLQRRATEEEPVPDPAPPDAWRLPQARPRNPIARIGFAISRRRYGHVVGPVAVTAHHPGIFAGWSVFELALERASRVDPRFKEIAATRAATLANSPFCVDFALGELPKLGFTDEQLGELPCWQDSESFTGRERLVLEYAEAITATPVAVSDELFERLRAEFDDAAIVELTATIAFENYRARFAQAVGLIPEGFCELPASVIASMAGDGARTG